MILPLRNRLELIASSFAPKVNRHGSVGINIQRITAFSLNFHLEAFCPRQPLTPFDGNGFALCFNCFTSVVSVTLKVFRLATFSGT